MKQTDDKHGAPKGPTFLSCPFCGRNPDPTDPSTLHPTGTVWRDEAEFRSYHSHSERQEGDGLCWVFSCLTESGGCGAEVHGDSEEQAIAAWNRRCAPSATVPAPDGHDDATARIEKLVREIEIICDDFGYDESQWLAEKSAVTEIESTQEPAMWRREWDGDVSDIGKWVYADTADERDEPLDRWQPLYETPQPAPPPLTKEEQAARDKALIEQFGAAVGAWRRAEERRMQEFIRISVLGRGDVPMDVREAADGLLKNQKVAPTCGPSADTRLLQVIRYELQRVLMGAPFDRERWSLHLEALRVRLANQPDGPHGE